MGLIGSMAVAIIGDISGLDTSLKQAKRDLNNFNKDVDKIASGISNMGSKLTMGITAPIVGAGAAAFKMAADLQDAMGATDQIFKASADSMKAWADDLPTYYGVAEGEALEYANMMGSMLQNIGGMTEEQAGKQAQTLVALAGDLTAMYGGTTADAVRALTGSLKGNNTMLDNYGMAVNDAMIKTKAMEMGLLSEGESMDLATKQAATLALIMEQTGAAQGQASREAAGASGSMRALVTELKNIATSIGDVLLPVITPFLARINEMLQGFKAMSPATQELAVKIALIAAAVGPALMVLGPLISLVGGAISTFGAMGIAIKAGAAGMAVFSAGFPTLATAFGLLTGPVGIAIGVIAGLATVIISLWKNNEDFRNGIIAIWEDIKGSLTAVVQFMTGIWENWGKYFITYGTAVWESVKIIISTALQIIGEIIALAMNLITLDFDGAWKNIENIFKLGATAVKNVVSTMTQAIKTIFLELIKDAMEWGSNLISSFTRGIRSGISNLKETVSDIAHTVSNFIGFESPTKEGPGRFVDSWGANMVEAFVDGMYTQMRDLRVAVGDMAVGLNPALAGAGGTNTNYGGATIYMTVNASNWSDIERELNRRGVRI